MHTHLHNNYKSHFGSDHMPVIHVVLILPGMPGRKPKVTIPKRERFLMVQNTNKTCHTTVISSSYLIYYVSAFDEAVSITVSITTSSLVIFAIYRNKLERHFVETR